MSFRRFCGFAAHEPTPERTAFVRFRRALVRRGLDRALFEAVTRQLETKGVLVRTGTLVDATLIPSASIRRDCEAKWAGHRRRKPTHGYKAHVATDEGAGLIRGVEVTTANVHDAAELAAGRQDRHEPWRSRRAYARNAAPCALPGSSAHRSHEVSTSPWPTQPAAPQGRPPKPLRQLSNAWRRTRASSSRR